MVSPCMMFSSSSSSYQTHFPALGKQTDPSIKVSSQPYVQSPPTGQLEEPHPFEVVLNWQTQNATSQNAVLQNLDHRVQSVVTHVQNTNKNIDSIVTQLEQMYTDLKNRVTQLNSELKQIIQQRYQGLEFDQKEVEICKLQAELSRIDSEKQQPSLFAPTKPLPRHTSLNTYPLFYTPSLYRKPHDYSKTFSLTYKLFQSSSKTQATTPPKQPTRVDTPPASNPSPQAKDKHPSQPSQPSQQYAGHSVPLLHLTSPSESFDSRSKSVTEFDSASDSEAEFTDITKLLMAIPFIGSNDPCPSEFPLDTPIMEESDETSTVPPHRPDTALKPSNGPWFTLDDIPKVKWPSRL